MTVKNDEQYDDTIELFYHDVPAELVRRGDEERTRQSEARMGETWPLERGRTFRRGSCCVADDRLFPARFIRHGRASAWESRLTRSTAGTVRAESAEGAADGLELFVRQRADFSLMRSSTALGMVVSKSRSLAQVGVIVMTTISS